MIRILANLSNIRVRIETKRKTRTWNTRFSFYGYSRDSNIRDISCPPASILIKVSPRRHRAFIANWEKDANWTKYRTAEEVVLVKYKPSWKTNNWSRLLSRRARGYYSNEIEVTTIETTSVDFEDRRAHWAHWTNKLSSQRNHDEKCFFYRPKSPFTSLHSLFLSAFVTS